MLMFLEGQLKGRKEVGMQKITQGTTDKNKINTFVQLLNLNHREKIQISQKKHFGDIMISSVSMRNYLEKEEKKETRGKGKKKKVVRKKGRN